MGGVLVGLFHFERGLFRCAALLRNAQLAVRCSLLFQRVVGLLIEVAVHRLDGLQFQVRSQHLQLRRVKFSNGLFAQAHALGLFDLRGNVGLDFVEARRQGCEVLLVGCGGVEVGFGEGFGGVGFFLCERHGERLFLDQLFNCCDVLLFGNDSSGALLLRVGKVGVVGGRHASQLGKDALLIAQLFVFCGDSAAALLGVALADLSETLLNFGFCLAGLRALHSRRSQLALHLDLVRQELLARLVKCSGRLHRFATLALGLCGCLGCKRHTFQRCSLGLECCQFCTQSGAVGGGWTPKGCAAAVAAEAVIGKLVFTRCNLFAHFGQLIHARRCAPHVQDGIPCALCCVLYCEPAPLHRAKVALHLASASRQSICKGALRNVRGFGSLALLLQALDLLVRAVREKVHPIVELQHGGQRLVAQGCKLLGGLVHRLPGGAFVLHCGLGGFLQGLRADLAGGRQCRQRLCGFALRAHYGADFLGVCLELCCIGASRVAGCDQGLVVGVGLLATLVVCNGENTRSGGGNGEWIHQPDDIPTQRTRRIACPTKHILELTALLQENRQRRLAALQAGHDVGELRGHATQRCGGLGCADAHLVKRARCRALGLLRLGLQLAQLLQGGLKLGRVQALVADIEFQALRSRLAQQFQLVRCALDGRRNPAFRAGELFRAGARAVADLVNGLACLACRRGNLIRHLLGLVAYPVEGGFRLFRVDDYLALNSQVRCHGCPNEKGPPKRARK